MAGARQHGIVDVATAHRLAGSAELVRRWVRAGRLERVAPGVLRIAGAPCSWEERLTAGLLTLGPEAMVSHEAAAQLFGFDRTPPDEVHFLVPRSIRRRPVIGSVHTSNRIERADRTVVDGFPVTSATRTVLDLAAAGVPRARLEAAIDSAVRSRRSSPVALARRLTTLRGSGRVGVRLLDRLLEDSGGESPLERRFLQLIRRAGLPRPQTQFAIRTRGQRVGRVDFVWPEHGLIVEVSGRLGHSSPSERAMDAHRRNELQALGWTVYEFTYQDLRDRGEFAVATVRQRLELV